MADKQELKIPAIETSYGGCRFRSRTEARWAVFFDALNIEWEYEKEGYDLGPELGWYLPDFWLPHFKMWCEVKGGEFTEIEKQKSRRLAVVTGHSIIMLDGQPKNKNYWGYFYEWPREGMVNRDGYCYTDEEFAALSFPFLVDIWFSVWRFEHEGRLIWFMTGAYDFEYVASDISDKAVSAAKSARFEHGQKGAFVEATA